MNCWHLVCIQMLMGLSGTTAMNEIAAHSRAQETVFSEVDTMYGTKLRRYPCLMYHHHCHCHLHHWQHWMTGHLAVIVVIMTVVIIVMLVLVLVLVLVVVAVVQVV